MRRNLSILSIGLIAIVLLASCDFIMATTIAAPNVTPMAAPVEATSAVSDISFLRVQGQQIVDGDGNPVILRGVNMDTFYYLYRWDPDVIQDYGTKDDIKLLAEMGANVIRLGLHWRYFEDGIGYELIDRYLEWCRANDIYVVLDMHIVPGDDDVLDGFIWDDPAAQQHLVELWAEIARHYHNEPIIAGYDIYNEPEPDDPARWWELAQHTVDAIRAVDSRHIIFMEDALSGSGFELLEESNLVYSFHDYSPFSVTHAGADWIGDTSMPAVSSYPGLVLEDIEWIADVEGAILEDDTNGWIYFDSGPLAAPANADWLAVGPFAWGDAGRVWFDDIEVLVDGEQWPLLNPGAEEEGWMHGGGYPANWNFESEGDYSGNWSTKAHTGSRSLTIEGRGDYAIWLQSDWVLTKPLIPADAGKEFRIRGWVCGENHGPEWGAYGLALHGYRNIWAEYDRSSLEAVMKSFLEWAKSNNVPLWVGEFGSMRHAPDDSGYRVIEDQIAIMNQYGLGWALWSYRDSDPQAFGLFHGPDDETTAESKIDQRLVEILREGFSDKP